MPLVGIAGERDNDYATIGRCCCGGVLYRRDGSVGDKSQAIRPGRPSSRRGSMRALVGGKVFNAEYQRQWLASLEPQYPAAPDGQKYGYGISEISFGPNRVYFHGGEMTSLTVSLDGMPTANTIMLKMLDQIYTVSPLRQK